MNIIADVPRANIGLDGRPNWPYRAQAPVSDTFNCPGLPELCIGLDRDLSFTPIILSLWKACQVDKRGKNSCLEIFIAQT